MSARRTTTYKDSGVDIDANDRMVVADVGHFESEQYTVDLLFEVLQEKFRNFAVLKSEIKTNPIHYYGAGSM